MTSDAATRQGSSCQLPTTHLAEFTRASLDRFAPTAGSRLARLGRGDAGAVRDVQGLLEAGSDRLGAVDVREVELAIQRQGVGRRAGGSRELEGDLLLVATFDVIEIPRHHAVLSSGGRGELGGGGIRDHGDALRQQHGKDGVSEGVAAPRLAGVAQHGGVPGSVGDCNAT
jgi:hypothetical protein